MSNLSSRLPVVILAVAAFLIVTTEYLIVGLLPALARDLGISISTAGQLVTLFAVVVALSGPPLTAALSHVDRKRLFVAILVVFALANALAASASSLWVLAIARFVPALALPVFWGTASETAAKLAGADRAGQAVSRVYLGISAALLFGIPLGTLIGDALGWRAAFWLLAVLCAVMAMTLAATMPRIERSPRIHLRDQAAIFREPFFLGNVALSVVVFVAMFTAYTYLADVLERLASVPSAQVGWWLMGFGAIGLVGNALGGKLVDRSPLAATGGFVALLIVGMLAAFAMTGSRLGFLFALAAWSIAYTALFPVSQVRVMKSVTHSQALAGTTNVAAANAGIAVGAVLGGIAIPTWGLGSIGIVAGIAGVLALAIIPLVNRLADRDTTLGIQPGTGRP
ncbi:MFS transporter [Luteibacter sp.]|jgi:predicted MFS family arabinose efflux permease|uniref:MFS transporter n=1 Tax=Luteibacter sp. TaxID=1886636 RepID=UPI002F40C537